MVREWRLPLFLVAAVLLGLIGTLAVLQYRWLGQISAAEQERLRSSLATRAAEFAQDFDRELTRAYLLFQIDVPHQAQTDSAERFALRYDHWHATSRYPKLISDFYLARRLGDGGMQLQRFNPSTRQLEDVEWPASMADWKSQLVEPPRTKTPHGLLVLRRMSSPIWDRVPAIVVPSPVMIFSARGAVSDLRVTPQFAYAVLAIDQQYVKGEMFPSLAERHFKGAGDVEYQVAVVERAPERAGVLFKSSADFAPRADTRADAAADLFQLRTQEFGAVASEIRRFTTFVAGARPSGAARDATFHIETRPREPVVVAPATPGIRTPPATPAPSRWRVLVKHPAGSLEAAVSKVRRRNLMISSGVLMLLAASLILITVSSQRAQRLARQQMEFVAAVSHELRTPLAVIRSAGENLADGVIRGDDQIRRYGDLVRNEGRRLTEMVEQILEFAGIQSGQRGLALRPVPIRPLLEDIVESSRALIDEASVAVEFDVPESLPPILGDEPALRRVFQNLIANAVKYGEQGKWIGLHARAAGREVVVSVKDRGIGIAAAEQARIFEPFYRTPDVIAAQIQGAGLGLSLVRRIVEAHGGRLSVRSAPGQGSEFIVRLPAAGQQPVAASDASESSQATAHPASARS